MSQNDVSLRRLPNPYYSFSSLSLSYSPILLFPFSSSSWLQKKGREGAISNRRDEKMECEVSCSRTTRIAVEESHAFPEYEQTILMQIPPHHDITVEVSWVQGVKLIALHSTRHSILAAEDARKFMEEREQNVFLIHHPTVGNGKVFGREVRAISE